MMTDASSAPKAPRPPTWLLVALTAFGPMSIDMYLPSLPDMTRQFHADISEVQLTLSVFVAGFAVAQLVYGPLSDRYGRRPVLMGGVLLYTLASIVCLMAGSIESLIAARFLQALGACAGPVLGRAILRDTFPREEAAKVMSTLASVMALAPAVAPMIGGRLHSWFGWQATFVLLTVFGAAMLYSGWKVLSETNMYPNLRALHPLDMVENYMTLLRDRVFLGYSLTISLTFCGMFAFISGASFVIIDVLGVRAENFGFCFTVVIVGFMSGSILSSKLTQKLGLERMVVLGTFLGVAAGIAMLGLALAGVQTIAAVIVPMAFVSCSGGLTLPNSTAAAIAPHPRIAGSASALLGFMQMGGASLAGLAVGHLLNGTTLPMAAVICVCLLLAAMARWLLIGRQTS